MEVISSCCNSKTTRVGFGTKEGKTQPGHYTCNRCGKRCEFIVKEEDICQEHTTYFEML